MDGAARESNERGEKDQAGSGTSAARGSRRADRRVRSSEVSFGASYTLQHKQSAKLPC